jgi:tRNA nucleotidyltransferase/poly(A) polymerase
MSNVKIYKVGGVVRNSLLGITHKNFENFPIFIDTIS